MLERVYVVTDLGPGDGGKGSIIHALSTKLKPSIIIKRGGAQGSHGINTSSGESFKFSQWGCGTFNGIPTYLSEQLVISPIGLINECEELKRFGIYNPYNMISSSPNCICVTPYHTISSQLEEIKLKENSRGTVGSGVGRAYRMYKQFGDDITIYSKELTNRTTIHNKLIKQLEYYRQLYNNEFNYLESDKQLVTDNIRLLNDDEFLNYIEDSFIEVGKNLKFQELSNILRRSGTAIIECSHGVLTDSELGLKPHVSAIRTLPEITCRMLKDSGYTNEIVNIGIHRAYEVRHGAGPLPTYDKEFTDKVIPNHKEDKNRWQGDIKAGALDFNMLKYAIKICENIKYDGICLTCFDQVLNNRRAWLLCENYENCGKEYQDHTEYFKHAIPIIKEIAIKNPISTKELFEIANNKLLENLGIPLIGLSFGSNEKQKILKLNGGH